MTGMVNPVIAESSLPIQVIYNSKIERIRILEFEIEKPPEPVKFDISDAYSASEYQKLVRIECSSAPKPYVLKIDLRSEKNPSIYETQMETFKRKNKSSKVQPLKLTDYLKRKNSKEGIEEFTKALHDQITTKVHNRTFKAKIVMKEKND